MRMYYRITDVKHIPNIRKLGLIIKKRNVPTFKNTFSGYIRQHRKCIYAFEHECDAIMLAFHVGGLQDNKWVLVRFESDAEPTHEVYTHDYCKCQPYRRGVVIKESVSVKNILSYHHLWPNGFYKVVPRMFPTVEFRLNQNVTALAGEHGG